MALLPGCRDARPAAAVLVGETDQGLRVVLRADRGTVLLRWAARCGPDVVNPHGHGRVRELRLRPAGRGRFEGEAEWPIDVAGGDETVVRARAVAVLGAGGRATGSLDASRRAGGVSCSSGPVRWAARPGDQGRVLPVAAPGPVVGVTVDDRGETWVLVDPDGAEPFELARVDPATGRTADHVVTALTSDGDAPAPGFAVAGGRAWVHRDGGGRCHLEAVSLATGTVEHVVPVCGGTVALAGGSVWVVAVGPGVPPALVPVDPATGRMGEGIRAVDAAFSLSGAGGRLWATTTAGTVAVDMATGAEVVRVAGVGAGGQVAAGPDGGAWVAGGPGGSAWRVDPSGQAHPVDLGVPAYGAVADGDAAWMLSEGDAAARRVDRAGRVTAVVDLPAAVMEGAGRVVRAGGRAYVAGD